MSLYDKAVEVERGTIREFTGTLYTRIPISIVRQLSLEGCDEVAYWREPGQDGFTIQIVKAATAPKQSADKADSQ